MQTKKLTTQISNFASTYDLLTECFGANLPAEQLAVFSGLPLEAVKALVLCKQIEQSIDQLNALLIKYPMSALGFSGSGRAHLINVCDDDTMSITFENFNVFESE